MTPPGRNDIRANVLVVLAVKLTTFCGRFSPYRLLTRVFAGRKRSARWTRMLTAHPIAGRRLVAHDRIDVASIYVALWLAVLLGMLLVVPAWNGASAAGRVVSVLGIVLAVTRFVDLVTYQVGILLDPRQRMLWSPARNLVLLGVNLVEITLASAVALYVLGDELPGGTPAGRLDAWVRAVNLIALLEPVKRAGAPLLATQVLTVASAVLLLVLAVGMLLGLMSQEFRNGRSESDENTD